MTDQTERLIESVRKYPYLFDRSHELYRNVSKKNDAWDEIAQKLNMTNYVAKMIWINLCVSYKRYKKSLKGETGQTKKYDKWPWSSYMSFLDRVQNSIIKKANDKTELVGPLSSTIEMFPTPKKVKSYTEATDNISELMGDKVINVERKKPQEKPVDAVDHLFLSYAETFRTFQPRTQSILKLKIATLFSEMELSELQEQRQASWSMRPEFSAPSSIDF